MRQRRHRVPSEPEFDAKTEDQVDKIERYERVGKLFAVMAFLFTAFVLLPYSLRVTGFLGEGSNIETWRLFVLFGGIVFVVLVVSGWSLVNNWRLDCMHKQHLREEEAIRLQTYQCIAPQILNRMVVFPVLVRRRDADKVRFLRITDDHVQVELTHQGDPTEELKELCADVFGADVETKVWIAGVAKNAGPTGLSLGIASDRYGSKLAHRIGQLIEEQIKKHLQAIKIHRTK